MQDKKDTAAEALEFLRSQLIAVISWNDELGHPASATVYFWMHDHDVASTDLYLITHRSSRKYEAMIRNKAVAMVVGTEFTPTSVQIQGQADLVSMSDSVEDLKNFLVRLGARPSHQRIYAGAFFPKNPFPVPGSGFAIFRVKPDWMRYMGYDKTKKEIFYQQLLP